MTDLNQTRAAHTAVIVVDLQTAMFDGVHQPPIHDADALVERVRMLLDWARNRGSKVAFIRHDGPSDDEGFAKGSPGWPLWPALGRADDEPIFSKSVGDAFSNPALGAWLSANAVRDVIIVGAQTDFCVAATVRGAHAQGLNVTVVDDGHSTWDDDGKPAAEIIAGHNVTFAAAGAHLVSTAVLVERATSR